MTAFSCVAFEPLTFIARGLTREGCRRRQVRACELVAISEASHGVGGPTTSFKPAESGTCQRITTTRYGSNDLRTKTSKAAV